MKFKEFLNEDMIKTVGKKLNISPTEFARQIFIINPPMKLRDEKGNVDTITSPTRFKVISMGKNFIRVKNLGFGNFPDEEKSDNAGKTYIIKGEHIDWFLRFPPGGGGGEGGMGGGMGGLGGGGGGMGASMGGGGLSGLGGLGGLGGSPSPASSGMPK